MGDVYYKLDKKSREELISTVKRVAIEILEGPQENWITADEVSKMNESRGQVFDPGLDQRPVPLIKLIVTKQRNADRL